MVQGLLSFHDPNGRDKGSGVLAGQSQSAAHHCPQLLTWDPAEPRKTWSLITLEKTFFSFILHSFSCIIEMFSLSFPETPSFLLLLRLLTQSLHQAAHS